MDRTPKAPWLGYVTACGAVALVLGLRYLLTSIGLTLGAPFLLLAFPVVIAAWVGGFGPGVLATVLTTAAGWFMLGPAAESTLDAAVCATLHLLLGLVISWLGQAHGRTLRRLEGHREELEQTIKHRTHALSEAITHLNREVQEHQVANQYMHELNERLGTSNQELQDFASVASHDLQEPLRKIQAFGDRLGTLYGEALGEQGLDYLQRMRAAAGRMQTLINDLLAFSRVTTKAQPFVPTDLNLLVAQVLDDLETRIEEKGARVEVESLPTIDADPMQLRQLVQNLLSNALKFARPEVQPHIRLWADVDENEGLMHLHVQDNGIGFDEKYLDRIFQVFQRLHGRGTYEGTGIGLAICRKIAERHQGTLTARSQPGEGSVFIASLPVAQERGHHVHDGHQTHHHSVG